MARSGRDSEAAFRSMVMESTHSPGLVEKKRRQESRSRPVMTSARGEGAGARGGVCGGVEGWFEKESERLRPLDSFRS